MPENEKNIKLTNKEIIVKMTLDFFDSFLVRGKGYAINFDRAKSFDVAIKESNKHIIAFKVDNLNYTPQQDILLSMINRIRKFNFD